MLLKEKWLRLEGLIMNSDQTTSPESFTSKLDTPKTVAIVGGGISSLVLADYLFKKLPNLKITLICKDIDLAQQGSSNKQGAIYPLLQAGDSLISNFYGRAFAHAITYYKGRLPDYATVPHQWTGVLQQAFNESMPTKFEEIATKWSSIVEFVDDKTSSKIANIDTPYSSLYFANGGWLNPLRFCQWLGVELQSSHDFTIQYNTEVQKVQRNDNDNVWSLHFDKKQRDFDRVVLCTGVDSPNIDYSDGNTIPIAGVLGQVSSFNPNTTINKLRTVLCHKGYITPSDGEHQAFGATFEKSWQNNEPTELARQQNINQIKKVFPNTNWAQSISINDINHDNTAIRATTPDHLPIAGEIIDWAWVEHYIDNNNGKYKRADKIRGSHDNPLQGLYCLTGLGARGITSAPILADMLSSVLANEPFSNNAVASVLPTVAPVRFMLREYKRAKGKPN